MSEKKKSSELRRSMPLLPIGTVMQLTELSARQIRYYEEHDLIQPHRSDGNRRMFSLNDVDTLLEIKDMLEQGINMAGIKKLFDMKKMLRFNPCKQKKKFLIQNYVEFYVKKCEMRIVTKNQRYVKGIYRVFINKTRKL